METCFYLCPFRMLTYLCWVCRQSRVGFFLWWPFLCLVFVVVFMHELCFGTFLLLGLDCKPGALFFFILHSLNVFDIFNKMGLLRESSDELSTVSPLSASAAGVCGWGVWGFHWGLLLSLIPTRNQIVRFSAWEYSIEPCFRMTCGSFKQSSYSPFPQYFLFCCGS